MPFQKGNTYAPGRPKLPEEVKQMRRLSTEEYTRVANKLMYVPMSELLEIAKDPQTVALEAMLAKIMLTAFNKGDARRLTEIFNRLLGKPPEVVHVSGPGGGPMQFEDLPPAKKQARITELDNIYKITGND